MGVLFSYFIIKKTILYRQVKTVKDNFVKQKNHMLEYIKQTELGKLDETTEKEIDEYLKKPKSTLFLGPTRSGKSFLMTNIGIRAWQEGSSVYWVDSYTLDEMSALFGSYKITSQEIFNAIVNDAKNTAIKNRKFSYILIDELALSPLISDPKMRSIFLNYLDQQSNKEYIKTLATTRDEKINPELYFKKNNIGRFDDLKVFFYEEDSPFTLRNKPYKEILDEYQQDKNFRK